MITALLILALVLFVLGAWTAAKFLLLVAVVVLLIAAVQGRRL